MSGQPRIFDFLTLSHLLLTLVPDTRDRQALSDLYLQKNFIYSAYNYKVSLCCVLDEKYHNSVVSVGGISYVLSYQREYSFLSGGVLEEHYYYFKLEPI